MFWLLVLIVGLFVLLNEAIIEDHKNKEKENRQIKTMTIKYKGEEKVYVEWEDKQ